MTRSDSARFAPLATLTALAALTLATGGACAATTWLTIGERAHVLLLQAAPQTQTVASRAVAVNVPERAGSRRLVRARETVFAVEVDDAVLPALSAAVHEKLHRCGGFVQHGSMAEALAVLHRIEGTAVPAVAPSYSIDNQASVNALLPQLQASNILSTITQMSNFQNRRYNSTHGVEASTWVYNTWQALNPGNRRDIKVRQITHAAFNQKSVEMEITGAGNSGETLVLGGHLDSISSGNIETQRAPGADDDASGVASITEVMRVLLANNFASKRNIRFIAYAAEEGGLLGSKDIVALQAARRDRVVGVMQLDMTAYQGDMTDLWIYTDYTNAAQNQFIANLAAAYLPQYSVGYDACGYGCSDHASWHNKGYIASFPFESADATYNPRIHTANDTVANFGGTASHALKYSQLALAWLVELASDMAPATRPAAETTADAR